MSTKSTLKASKKRKVGTTDPSQHKLDHFLSQFRQTNSLIQVKNDSMQVDTAPTPIVTPIKSSTGYPISTQQTLSPAIIIASFSPSRLVEISQSDFDKSWSTQRALILNIFSDKDNKSINYVTASRLSEGLCRFGKSEALYLVLHKEIENHVQHLKSNLLNLTLRQNILSRLNNSWNTFCTHLKIIRNVFMELDRTYVLSTKYTSIIQLGKCIFSETILDASEFRGVVIAEVLGLIKLDRDGHDVDTALIQAILHMLVELSYYSSDFEPRFLTSTISYYKDESSRLIKTLSIPDYIQHAFKRREEESDQRVKNYLDTRTKQELAFAVTNQLIYQKAEIIISKGFNSMMESEMNQPLKIFYDLLDQNPKMTLLRNAFGEYIKMQGSTLIKEPKNDITMINTLLKFKKKVDRILRNCFGDDASFSNASKESFEYFINTRGNKPAELLAKFIDSKLKSPNKKNQRNVEIDLVVLDSALVLFRYIQSKDAFEAYYKRYLAKRLLQDRSLSIEIENHILEKLKIECGYEFTKNLETMFNDIQISNELNTAFKEFETNKSRIPIQVKVIAQGTWPAYPINNIKLPTTMVSTQRLFEKFYSTKYNGRKLVWQNSLSSCSLIAHYPKGDKEIIFNLSQAIVLLSFNKGPYTFSELKSVTGLDEKDLMAILYSLSSEAYPLITNGSNEPISRNDTFKFNEEFETPNVKVKIPPATLDQVTEEQKDVEKKVQINRQHQLEAALVRIMKAKKTLSHNSLIDEVFKEVNYPVEASEVKKRLESLIDRDYIARDTEDSTLYIYQS